MGADVAGSYLKSRGSWALWYAFLGGPVAWVLELFFIYPAVPYACNRAAPIVLYLIGALALIVSLGAGIVGYRIWSDAGAELPGDQATRTDRSRLMATVGMMGSALFSLILIGQLIAIAVLGPCIPLPRVHGTPDAQITPIRAPVLAFTTNGAP